MKTLKRNPKHRYDDEGRPIYCQATTRRQIESGSWGETNRGCERPATVHDDRGHWCHQHADPSKRY